MLLRVCLGACRTRSTAAGNVCHENVRQVADGVSVRALLEPSDYYAEIVATQPEGSLECTSPYRETSITILSISSGPVQSSRTSTSSSSPIFRSTATLLLEDSKGILHSLQDVSGRCDHHRIGRGGSVRGGERRPGVHRRGHKTESKCSCSRSGSLISVFRSVCLD
jgi:hypothetical protein